MEGAMFRLLMIVLIMALGREAVFAETETDSSAASANALVASCRAFADEDSSRQTPLNEGFCGGIVVGLAYADPTICVPDGLTYRQSVRVVVQYIDQQPSKMHEPFVELATQALRSAWRCKRGQRPMWCSTTCPAK
jgi:hypothetical protein